MIKKKIFLSIILIFYFVFVNIVHAETRFNTICLKLAPQYQAKCNSCHADQQHIWTAIGCLPTDFTSLIGNYIFSTGLKIAGGIAFLYFIYGTFVILTSAGNAEQLEEAKQIIISSLSGLLLIIFSIFLLKIIGVDILGLPDFK